MVTIYKRVRFNQRNSKVGRPQNNILWLAQHCNYGEIKDEMIRDQLVVGIRHCSWSEKLQLDPSLTPETAKMTIHQREAVHEHQKVLKGNDKSTADCRIDAMQHKQQGNCYTRGQR